MLQVKKPAKFILLILGILFFVAGFFSLVFHDKEGEVKYQSIIQNNIDNAISTARTEHAALQDKVKAQKKESFENYELKTTYPYFIFKDDSLIYWSSYKYIPEEESRGKGAGEIFVEYHKNSGLLVKSPFRLGTSNYEVVSLIDLYRFNEITPGFDYGIFYTIPRVISRQESAGTFKIRGSDGKPLFYVTPTENPQTLTMRASKGTLLLFSAGLILIGIFCVFHISALEKKHRYMLASINLILLVLFIRLWMLMLGLPWQLMPESLTPEYLVVPPGFGDMILSAFSVTLVLAFMALWQLEALTYTSIKKYSVNMKSMASVVFVLAAIALGYFVYMQVLKIYNNQVIGLDYSLKLTNIKMGTYLFLFSLFGIYFLGNHLLINVFSKIQASPRPGFMHWLYGTLLTAMFFYYHGLNYWICLICALYFLAAFLLKMPRYFYILRFKTFVYFLTGGFAFTFILFSLVTRQDYDKSLEDKQLFAEKLLQQKDLKAELLLNQFSNMIQNDTTLANTLGRPVLAYESLRYLIKDSLLSPYFDAYDVEVQAYTTSGRSLASDSPESLSRVYAKYAGQKNKTEFPGLYFLRNENGENMYVLFSEVRKNGIVRGAVMVKVSYNASELAYTTEKLTDNTLRREPGLATGSYVLFDKNRNIIYKEGNFDYSRDFDLSLPETVNASDHQVLSNGFLHYIRKDKDGNVAVVTQPSDFYRDTLSGFSYLFLITLSGMVVLLVILGVISGFQVYRMSFSSKIQFFLNLAFLVPLTIIILLTLGVVISSFITLQNRSIQENSLNVANTINLHYQDYLRGKSTKAYLEEQLSNLALSSDFEISIFNPEGRLTYTSTPGLYRMHQLSGRINPEAYARIMSGKNSEVLLEETLGSLDFKTVYLNGKAPDGKTYGVIGISYPEAGYTLQRQIKEVGAAILIIFLIMFFILLALSYTASTNLTDPLKLIAQKLKKTNLNAKNEEIVWRSNDEIGILTNEYNRMIKKLEESREALSASEKQTAWREMARQVAHEIKNPLTPMKLSIQQLQRTLPADSEETRQKIDRALASINEQIDNISEIANSFSEFAKMPVPRTEVFDLVSAVQKTVDLYTQNNNIKIRFRMEADEIMVTGDKMILSRAVNNLVLNGLQSVPATRKPIISVSVSEKGDMGIVEVQDNGTGISEELRKKVFIPNFSTKQGGSGLGLSMAKRGIEHAGGNIWFESVEGEGTTFYVELPKSK